MPKFYIYRTCAAEVTDIYEVEASDEDFALATFADGEGRFVGATIGDYIGWALNDMTTEALPASENDLPLGLLIPEKEIINA